MAMTGIRHRFLMAMGLAGALALGGCAYDDGYGYGGVNVGTGYYGGGYDDGYYGSSGYYQPGYYNGWYDGFYYPGNGYYVYDRGGRRQRWNDGQRRYWEGRRAERHDDRNDGRGNGRWQGNRDGRNDRWQGQQRPPNNGQAGNGQVGNGQVGNGQPGNRPPGNWSRPRPQPGVNGEPGRGRWQRNNAVRPTPQAPAQGQQSTQPRPQRDWGARATPGNAERAGRSRNPGGSRQVRPD
ncbi:MAG: peptidase [Sphingomonadaceae bacterium]|nr:peptidase [Sphingomonadaceae bacterium]MBH2000130.1 peptidase [Sphingomonadaceae bacterium]